jgi:hypothetical protein
MGADEVAVDRRRVSTPAWLTAWLHAGQVRIDLAAMVAALAAVLLFHYSGAVAATRDSFVFMGFDVDRAYLLVGAMAAGLGGAVAAMVGGRRLTWVGSGLLGLVVTFGHTFLDETSRAMSGAGGAGTFDPLGWAVTAAALVSSGMALGLAAGILGSEARAGIVATGHGVARAWRAREPRSLPRGRLFVTALLVAGLAIAIPVAGQLLNYGPDSLMLSGGAGGIPLTGEGGGLASVPPTDSQESGAPAPSSAGSGLHGAGHAPWAAWAPSGSGTVLERTLPAPWTGGTSNVVHFSVYLPPGYGTGARRYPVVYELPWPITLYDDGADIRPTLDRMIDTGNLPASIVVFLSSRGGPLVDNECIDAANGQEPFDTFVGTTLVRYVDTSFRTIRAPAARTLLGDSQGGFCAANVLLHHPDVFHQEISFSGYFTAAPILGMSPSAQAPYAGDRTLEINNSPMLIDSRLPYALRRQLLFTLIAGPQAPFYGSQYLQFGNQARTLGYLVDQIPTPYGHSWLAVRSTIGPALRAVADREAAEGIFATS